MYCSFKINVLFRQMNLQQCGRMPGFEPDAATAARCAPHITTPHIAYFYFFTYPPWVRENIFHGNNFTSKPSFCKFVWSLFTSMARSLFIIARLGFRENSQAFYFSFSLKTFMVQILCLNFPQFWNNWVVPQCQWNRQVTPEKAKIFLFVYYT